MKQIRLSASAALLSVHFYGYLEGGLEPITAIPAVIGLPAGDAYEVGSASHDTETVPRTPQSLATRVTVAGGFWGRESQIRPQCGFQPLLVGEKYRTNCDEHSRS